MQDCVLVSKPLPVQVSKLHGSCGHMHWSQLVPELVQHIIKLQQTLCKPYKSNNVTTMVRTECFLHLCPWSGNSSLCDCADGSGKCLVCDLQDLPAAPSDI